MREKKERKKERKERNQERNNERKKKARKERQKETKEPKHLKEQKIIQYKKKKYRKNEKGGFYGLKYVLG
jgi:hypothetical protein